MTRTLASLLVLAGLVLGPGLAHGAATYDGDLTVSISIASCQGGSIAFNCASNGVTFTGSASAPSQLGIALGGGTATASASVQSFGTGTFTQDAKGKISGTGLVEGSGFSAKLSMSGGAFANGDAATSLADAFLDFIVFNQRGLSTQVNFQLDYTFDNVIAIDDPATDGALSRSRVAVHVSDFNVNPTVPLLELLEDACGNMDPANFVPGFNSQGTGPCSGSASTIVSFTYGSCPSPVICVGGFMDVDVSQLGIAQVLVPQPATVSLLVSALGALAGLRWKRGRARAPARA
jgi:hypothetical protein